MERLYKRLTHSVKYITALCQLVAMTVAVISTGIQMY